MKPIIINSDQARRSAISLVEGLPMDGTMEVVVKKADKSATAKQRRLSWQWYKEVAESGKGQHDTKEAVHAAAKWQFARPILLKEDEVFGIIYSQFMDFVKGTPGYSECCRVFASEYISTERMTKRQRAEMMTDFQRYWTREGVALTDPDSMGLDLEKLAGESKR